MSTAAFTSPATVIDELATCYAERTDVRHPFNPLGDTPLRSRAAVREHFAAGDRPAGVERYDVVDDHVHTTPDPEVVVFEFRYAGVIDGRAFTMPCIFVIRVRDGEIVESRDYVDHVAAARAFGRLPTLAAALAAPSSHLPNPGESEPPSPLSRSTLSR
jgi:ketosteroid isomerase-like protein